MAARKTAWTPERVRQRIRTTQLIRRLKKHALGKVEMTATQVKAVEILLRKCLPDLSAVEYTGDSTTPLTRKAIDDRIAELLSRASGAPVGPGGKRTPEPDGGSPTTH